MVARNPRSGLDDARIEKSLALVAECKKKYTNFLQVHWQQISHGKAPLTPYELDAAAWAVDCEEGRVRKARFLHGHRELGKSTIITYPAPAWFWLNDATAHGSTYMKANDKAEEAIATSRHLLRVSPMLKHLEPPAKRESWHKDNSKKFWVRGAVDPNLPSLKAMGSTSMSTSGRGNFLFLDDFETYENSKTRESRAATAARSREIIRTARAGCLIVGIGTYARDESAYQEWIDDDETWEHRIYPLLYPTDEERQLATNSTTGESYYAPCVLEWLDRGYDYLGRKTYPGGIIQPERWTPEYVAQKRGKHLAEFRRHYQGIRRSGASADQPLRLSDLMVLNCAGPSAPSSLMYGETDADDKSTIIETIEVDAPGNSDAFRRPARVGKQIDRFAERAVMQIDTAGEGEDEMAWSVWSEHNGLYFCRKLYGSQLRSPNDDDPERIANRITLGELRTDGELIDPGAYGRIFADIVRFGVTKCVVEQQFGGIAIAERIRSMCTEAGVACSVDTEHASGDKRARLLATLKPMTYDHLVVVDEAVARDTTFQYQYTRLSPAQDCLEHDDRVETFAAGLKLISEGKVQVPISHRQMTSLMNRRDDILEQLGRAPEEPRWGDQYRN